MKLIKNLYKKSLFKKKNVCGVGLGYKVVSGHILDEPCITVAVTKKEDVDKKDFIPPKIWGVETDVVEVGDLEEMWRKKHRPCKLGSSCSSEKLTACSLGLPVYDEDGNSYLLMNEHCTHPEGWEEDDLLLQPAPADGGRERDKIGKIGNYCFGVKSGKENIDASLCPIEEEIVHRDVAGMEYEEETEYVTQKHILKDILGGGRTIGRLAKGAVIAYDFEAQVWGSENGERVLRKYPDCILAINHDQTGPIVMGGDSSSIRFIDGKPLLQTFAGSDTAAIFNQTKRSLDYFEYVTGKRFSLKKPIKEGYVALGRFWYVKPEPGKYTTTVNLNLRKEPNVHSSTLIKTLPKGTEIEVKEFVGLGGGYYWARVDL